MRNALGLMLASVVTAVAITAVWFWMASARVEIAAAPATLTAPLAERIAAVTPAKPAAAHDDVDITGAIAAKTPVSTPPKSTCANPDALGISRVVVIDTAGGP